MEGNYPLIPNPQGEIEFLQQQTTLGSTSGTAIQQAEPPQIKKGMGMAGVGESAVGAAAVLLLKEQMFDKNPRQQLQQQIKQLLQQQAWISSQILEINRKINRFGKEKEGSFKEENLMM